MSVTTTLSDHFAAWNVGTRSFAVGELSDLATIAEQPRHYVDVYVREGDLHTDSGRGALAAVRGIFDGLVDGGLIAFQLPLADLPAFLAATAPATGTTDVSARWNGAPQEEYCQVVYRKGA